MNIRIEISVDQDFIIYANHENLPPFFQQYKKQGWLNYSVEHYCGTFFFSTTYGLEFNETYTPQVFVATLQNSFDELYNSLGLEYNSFCIESLEFQCDIPLPGKVTLCTRYMYAYCHSVNDPQYEWNMQTATVTKGNTKVSLSPVAPQICRCTIVPFIYLDAMALLVPNPNVLNHAYIQEKLATTTNDVTQIFEHVLDWTPDSMSQNLQEQKRASLTGLAAEIAERLATVQAAFNCSLPAPL